MHRVARFGVLAFVAFAMAAPAVPVMAADRAATVACAQGRRAQVERELQAVLDQATVAGAPHAALLRIECGREVWSLASGVADVQTGRKARPGDRFRAGSILKPAIATVVLQLVEEGRLSLDEAITRRLPDRYTSRFADADAITVRMLLNHRSGIGEWTEANLQPRILAEPGKVWKPEEYIAISVERGPKFKPGAAYAYNNTEYVLLGLVIEQVTGRSWRDSVRERVLAPIGIPSAALPPSGVEADLRGHMRGYQSLDGRELDVSSIDPSMAGPAGGHAFAPTTEELSRFMKALLAGRYFKRPETLAQMVDYQATSDNAPNRPVGYGLGLGKFDFPEGVTGIGHTGSTGGYLSFVFRIPELDITMTGATSDRSGAVIGKLGAEARRIIVQEARR